MAKHPDLVDCPRGELLLQGLRSVDLVVIYCEPDGKWIVPRQILRLESDYLTKVFESEKTLAYTFSYRHSRNLTELFLQWLFTGSYQEHDRAVAVLQTNASEKSCRCLEKVENLPHDTMSWVMKASIQAWLFGEVHGALRFQNYTMRRLFVVLSANDWIPQLHPLAFSRVFQYIYDDRAGYGPMVTIFEHVFIRNWDNRNIIDLTDSIWSDILKKNDHLREKFLRAVMTPLEERRKITLQLKDLLIKEE